MPKNCLAFKWHLNCGQYCPVFSCLAISIIQAMIWLVVSFIRYSEHHLKKWRRAACKVSKTGVNFNFFFYLGLEEKHKPKVVLEAAPEPTVEGGKKKKKPRAQNNCLFCKNPGKWKIKQLKTQTFTGGSDCLKSGFYLKTKQTVIGPPNWYSNTLGILITNIWITETSE